MALPTDYYEQTELGQGVYCTRIKGGYIFSVNAGNQTISETFTDSEVLAAFFEVSGLPTTYYELTNLSININAVLVDGGWLIIQNTGRGIVSSKMSFAFASGSTSETDHHSGIKRILESESYTINVNRQMTVRDGIEITGSLVIDGELILT